ncbi:MAG: DMT family transporter [Anaerolineae bacterium]
MTTQLTQWRGVFYGITAAAIWGGMYVVSDVVLEVIPSFTLLSLRLILGALSLSVFLWGEALPILTGRDLARIAGVGMVGYSVSLGTQFVGTYLSTAVNGAIVTSSTPAFVVLFAILILHESLTFRRALAIALATLGVIVIIDFTQAQFNSDTFVGNVFLAIAGITWGLFSVLIRWVSQHYSGVDTLFITLIAFCGGLTLSVPASVLELTQQEIVWEQIGVGVIAGVLFIGVISTAVAFWLWNRTFALLDASTASVLFFVQPISGALLGWLFLGQALTLTVWIGGGLIVLGVLLSI